MQALSNFVNTGKLFFCSLINQINRLFLKV